MVQLLSWLYDSPLRWLLSAGNLSGLCKTSFKGHCLGMQTASRLYTPAETCYLKMQGSKLNSLLSTRPQTSAAIHFRNKAFLKNNFFFLFEKRPFEIQPPQLTSWWLPTQGNLQCMGVTSLISSPVILVLLAGISSVINGTNNFPLQLCWAGWVPGGLAWGEGEKFSSPQGLQTWIRWHSRC